MVVLNAGTKPETPGQAKTFTLARNFYARAGLCNRCAAQAAFGHQNGFTGLHAPCADCQPIVDTFPLEAAGPWRKVRRPRGGSPQGSRTQTPSDAPPATAWHPKCGKRYSGSGNVGHCSVCCGTFVGLCAFDAHLSRDEAGNYFHLDPATAPGEQQWWLDGRGYWHQGQRLTEEQIAALRNNTKEDAND